MYRKPLLTRIQLKAYSSSLTSLLDNQFIDEAAGEIAKGFFDAQFAINDQKANACYDEANRRDKPYLYARGYNKARANYGLEVNAKELAAAKTG